jgi:hypothetical protein
MTTRPAVTIFDEDTAITILKPYSGEYKNQLIMIYEDAYGEMVSIMEKTSDLKAKLNITDIEFNEILEKLK